MDAERSGRWDKVMAVVLPLAFGVPLGVLPIVNRWHPGKGGGDPVVGLDAVLDGWFVVGLSVAFHGHWMPAYARRPWLRWSLIGLGVAVAIGAGAFRTRRALG